MERTSDTVPTYLWMIGGLVIGGGMIGIFGCMALAMVGFLGLWPNFDYYLARLQAVLGF
jgi:hypothetical protein